MDTNLSLNRLQSVFWMMCWAASFSLAMALMKLLHNCDTFTVVFIRFLFALVVVAPAILKSSPAEIKTHHLKSHFLNAVLRCGGIFCTYYAYANLPMAFAASIGFTAPFIAITLALLLLRERVEVHKWIAVSLGYGGVLIMVNPQDAHFNVAIIASLIANVCAGFSQVLTKKLSQTETNLQIMFYINTFCVVLTSIIVLYNWRTPELYDWPLLLLIGGAGTLSQYSFIRAVRTSDVSFVAPYEYIRLLFAVPIGIYLFNEFPTPLGILGSLIIVGCSGFLTYMEVQTQRQQKLLA